MLDQIPSEIISRISYHLSLSHSKSSTTFQDIPPLNLLLSCRTINQAISPSTNPRLYGKLFRALFDIEAPERRFQTVSSSSKLSQKNKTKKRMINRLTDGEDDESYGDKLKAQELAKELKKRVECLRRLKEMVDVRDVTDIEEEDLWIVYLMLIENDGKNIKHLIGPKATVNLLTFLELYHDQHFLAAAVEPGYPAETVGRSLAMWVAWLVGGSGPPDETPEQREERMFVLRPYVFAAQQYPLYFAPWVLPDLPLSHSSPSTINSIELDNHVNLNPFIADLTPKSRSVVIEHFGRSISLCPPFLAHAAILRFFYRRLGEDGDLDSDTESTMDIDMVTSPFMALQNQHQGAVGVRVNDLVDGIMPGTQGIILSNPASRAPTRPTSPTPPHGFIPQNGFLVGNSRIHDLDFLRLKSCYDPYHTKGLKSTNWRNSWEGCWEGTFSFFDFDAFREMLAGHSRALYEGPYGEQAQVWRLTETYVRKEGWVKKVVEQDEDEDEDEYLDSEEEEEEVKGLPLNGPIVNAGFPSTETPNTYSNLASATAEAETLRQTIQQQIEAIKGYEIVPPEELEDMLDLNEEEQEEAGLEMLLSGTGHSAWGKFILKGRVRNWDGMASLVKEYAPDSRGKWIYRGYVLAGDIFVGRWRDTYTPETFVGYEGTFILNRR
ncbi:hypothetical protein V866_007123 [Kwoniella sp. B9012]